MSDQPGVILVAGHGAADSSLLARLKSEGHVQVLSAANADGALEAMDRQAAELMLVDCASLPELARELLATAHERWPDLPLIALQSTADKDEIIATLGAGASDVISPEEPAELSHALKKALARVRHAEKLPAQHGFGDLVLGRSRAMRAV